MLLIFLSFYVLLIPLFILLHEVGHGLGAVFSSDSEVHIYLGIKSGKIRKTLRLEDYIFILFGLILALHIGM